MFYPEETVDCLLLCYNPHNLSSSLLYCHQLISREELRSETYKCLVGLSLTSGPVSRDCPQDEVTSLAEGWKAPVMEISSEEEAGLLLEKIIRDLLERNCPLVEDARLRFITEMKSSHHLLVSGR